jgi:hypothetical protein
MTSIHHTSGRGNEREEKPSSGEIPMDIRDVRCIGTGSERCWSL